MTREENIYFEDHGVTVTASRVVIAGQHFVVRNIASVHVHNNGGRAIGIVYAVICLLITFFCWMLFESLEVACIGAILVFCCLYFCRDSFFVQIRSGMLPVNLLGSASPSLPERVVEAINSALLEIDASDPAHADATNLTSSEPEPPIPSPADEILKYKKLLDAGAISQEEYDQKK